MFEPCFEHCFLRFGKQYTPDCDDKCAYAKAVKERDNAVELIKYLDKNYSFYMNEDEKFDDWRNHFIKIEHNSLCETETYKHEKGGEG